jgi:dihydroorotate dehydrogenase
MDLRADIGGGWSLSDPFMIASSHWTANENAFRQLRSRSPAAVTLKTTSPSMGGDGALAFERRRKTPLEDSYGNQFALFTDGPKTLELLDIPSTYKLTETAKNTLPETAIGLSVLQGEDYQNIAASLQLSSYAYVELNLKYSFRAIGVGELNDHIKRFSDDVDNFCDVFRKQPKIIKFSREATQLIRLGALSELLARIDDAKGAILIANSLRIRVPPSRTSPKTLEELQRGVVIGEHLFLDTYDLIRLLSARRSEGEKVPPIIASGGIIDIGGVVDILAAGAVAVQLCTALDLQGPHFLSLIKTQLQAVGGGYANFEHFRKALVTSPSDWHDAAEAARELRVSPSTSAEKVLKDEDVKRFLSEALAAELGNKPPEAERHDDLGRKLRFVFTKGNVLSFVVGRRLLDADLIDPLERESAGDFCRNVADAKFEWDLGILPASALEYLGRQNKSLTGERAPVDFGEVGRSRFELVGDSQLNIQNVEKVYHFGGNSSRWALGELLRAAQQKAAHPEIVEIAGSELFSLLSTWEPRSAILAKPPLSMLYGKLCHSEIRGRWGPFWSVEEPLRLVGSRRFAGDERARNVAATVATRIHADAKVLLDAPDRLLRYTRGEGLLEYFAQLLVGKPR